MACPVACSLHPASCILHGVSSSTDTACPVACSLSQPTTRVISALPLSLAAPNPNMHHPTPLQPHPTLRTQGLSLCLAIHAAITSCRASMLLRYYLQLLLSVTTFSYYFAVWVDLPQHSHAGATRWTSSTSTASQPARCVDLGGPRSHAAKFHSPPSLPTSPSSTPLLPPLTPTPTPYLHSLVYHPSAATPQPDQNTPHHTTPTAPHHTTCAFLSSPAPHSPIPPCLSPPQVMALHGTLGLALSPSGRPLVSTSIMPGGAESLRGFN